MPLEWGDLVSSCCAAIIQVTPGRLSEHPTPRVSHLLQKEWACVISEFPLVLLCYNSFTYQAAQDGKGGLNLKDLNV